MGFQHLGPGITVLSPSDVRPSTVRFDSIVVLAGGRRRCIGLDGVGFAPSNEDLAFRASVCHLMNLFLRTMFKLRQGPVQFLELFFGHWAEEFFLKRLRFWNHFGSFLGPGTLPGNGFLPFARWPCNASWARKKCMFWLSADETSLSNQSGR